MARVAVITGASRGLGRALAESLGARGWAVLGVARGADALSAAMDRIRARGSEAVAFPADIADPDAPARIAGRAEAIGPVELLVHCASTLGPIPLRPILDVRPEELTDVLAANVVGPFRLTRAIAGAMRLRGRGAIGFASSDAAIEAYPGWGAYGLSKAAADHLAATLAVELAPIRVFSFDPGEMDTAMHAAAIPDADRSTLADPAEVAPRILAALVGPPRKRFRAVEVAP